MSPVDSLVALVAILTVLSGLLAIAGFLAEHIQLRRGPTRHRRVRRQPRAVVGVALPAPSRDCERVAYRFMPPPRGLKCSARVRP